MNPEEILKKVESSEVILLDVRELDEWSDGHIAGSKNISLGDLNSESTKDLPKDIPIFVHCRSGARAGSAELILQDLGFENVQSIGGIFDWQYAGGELVQ